MENKNEEDNQSTVKLRWLKLEGTVKMCSGSNSKGMSKCVLAQTRRDCQNVFWLKLEGNVKMCSGSNSKGLSKCVLAQTRRDCQNVFELS